MAMLGTEERTGLKDYVIVELYVYNDQVIILKQERKLTKN